MPEYIAAVRKYKPAFIHACPTAIEPLATWSESASHARPGFQVADRMEGRLQEFLVCKHHRLVLTTSMCAPHFEVLVTADRIQFEQHEPGRAVLKVLSSGDLSAETKARVDGWDSRQDPGRARSRGRLRWRPAAHCGGQAPAARADGRRQLS